MVLSRQLGQNDIPHPSIVHSSNIHRGENPGRNGRTKDILTREKRNRFGNAIDEDRQFDSISRAKTTSRTGLTLTFNPAACIHACIYLHICRAARGSIHVYTGRRKTPLNLIDTGTGRPSDYRKPNQTSIFL